MNIPIIAVFLITNMSVCINNVLSKCTYILLSYIFWKKNTSFTHCKKKLLYIFQNVLSSNIVCKIYLK